MKRLLIAALLLFGCAGRPAYEIEPEDGRYVQRFVATYLVNNHIEWWQDPFYRPADDESYPKIVVISDQSMACVLTAQDPNYGRWASAQERDPFACPRPWRRARWPR